MDLLNVSAFRTGVERVFRGLGIDDVAVDAVYRVDRRFFVEKGRGITIGLAGGLDGSVSLLYEELRVATLVSAVVKETIEVDDKDSICEIMSELANMIAGNAVTQLSGTGLRIDISPPTIVDGPGIQLEFSAKARTARLPVVTKCGSFDLVLSFSQG